MCCRKHRVNGPCCTIFPYSNLFFHKRDSLPDESFQFWHCYTMYWPWKDRIIVVLTCRRSVQFRCYITWHWMANCVSVMIKMLPLFNFTISCNSRRAWKTTRCSCALAGSRLWLVESTLFGDHVSLRLHREFSLKFNLFNWLPGTH